MFYSRSCCAQGIIWPYQSPKDTYYLASQINKHIIDENKKVFPTSANIFLNPISLYQKYLSRSSCQYFPSCSRYTYQAIEKFGILKGLVMSSERLLRCSHHPEQIKYYKIGPYFYDYPFDVFKFKNSTKYEESYEYKLLSSIAEKLNFAYYPTEPIFKPHNCQQSASEDSLLFLFPENTLQDTDFKFAIHLYHEKEYFQAATEFKRCLINNNRYEDNILFLIGCCNYYAKRYSEAISYFDNAKQHANNKDFYFYCEFLKAISYYNNRDIYHCEQILVSFLDEDIKPFMKRNVILTLISLYSKTDDVFKINELLNKTGNKFSNKELEKIVENLPKKQKSPKLAMLLSIIPGLGHLYSSSYKEGVYSFLTNATLGYFVYDSYQNGSNSGKILSSVVFLQFYSGNIIGGKRAAEVYNNLELEKINSQLQPLIQLSPEFKMVIRDERIYLKMF